MVVRTPRRSRRSLALFAFLAFPGGCWRSFALGVLLRLVNSFDCIVCRVLNKTCLLELRVLGSLFISRRPWRFLACLRVPLVFPGAPWRSLSVPVAFLVVRWRSVAFPGGPKRSMRSLAFLGSPCRFLSLPSVQLLSGFLWRSLAFSGVPSPCASC